MELFDSPVFLLVQTLFLLAKALRGGRLRAFGFGGRVVDYEMDRVVLVVDHHYGVYQAWARIAHR
jgi:hypothetical protein